MKILVVGASGVIGSAIVNALSGEHQVISASRSSGDVNVDLSNPASIRAMFAQIDQVDAIISAAGEADIKPLEALTDQDYDRASGMQLMDQINLFRYGKDSLAPGGSVTLTSGAASKYNFPGAAAIGMAFAGLERFADAAAQELTDIRLNVVSPTSVTESMEKLGWPTEGSITAADTAKSYLAAVTGTMNGQTLSTAEYA
ncbi:short chain dehydrogenase [Parasedimentitalea psychrophila]|uniref:Short chain dehydrogenase n=1 Tax=Parasedimentitalea psychrophila TaxID=2997337 RepID=A0A9Y2P1X2_9RHOB|nr:short chain dehydrogenase [Parasedimentitalea psychrophila]WIY24512.1 short chain dehydrogenase [Parasedimentitalea psychrophila]